MILLLQVAIDAVTAAANAASAATTAAATAAKVATNASDYLHAPSPLADQIGAAAISAWVIQQMKKSNLPVFKWVNDHNTLVTRGVSIGFAILSTSGIHAFWHGNGTSVLQGGTFVLNLADGWVHELQQSVWKTTQSFIMQQLVYQGVLKHEKGQQAADTVADVVQAHKEKIAEVVENAESAQDPSSILKLKDNPAVKAELNKKRDTTASDVVDASTTAAPGPSDFDWRWGETRQRWMTIPCQSSAKT